MPETASRMPPCGWVQLAEWSRAQVGAVSVAQLRAAGVSRAALQARPDARRWQRVWPRVYATFSGPLPEQTRRYGALLYAGPRATLSHATAAGLWGLRAQPSAIHLLTPYGVTVAAQPGLVVHRTRRLVGVVHPALEPARTRAEQTVIDLLPTTADLAGALGLVADAVQRVSPLPSSFGRS